MASSETDSAEGPKKSPYGLPLPSKIIQVLSEDDIGGRDLLIVGDVHGCYDELRELIETNAITKENTCVVFVGDLVNKGPKSLEVVEYIIDNGWYSVRGNHDEISISESMKDDPMPKYQWVTNFPKKSLDWLSELPYAIQIPSRQIIVVHAGLLPYTPLEQQDLDAFLHMRCVRQNDASGPNSSWEWIRQYNAEDYQLWGGVWPGPEHVYFGHDARRFFQEHKYATGLDTACVYGVELTAIYPLGRQVIKITSHQNYSGSSKYDKEVEKRANQS